MKKKCKNCLVSQSDSSIKEKKLKCNFWCKETFKKKEIYYVTTMEIDNRFGSEMIDHKEFDSLKKCLGYITKNSKKINNPMIEFTIGKGNVEEKFS